jgi:hypothetical protein
LEEEWQLNADDLMSRAISTADDIIAAMAYKREQFKDRVEEKLGGALLEHYKAVLARLNRQTRWVRHWEREADRLVRQELPVVLLHSIKGFRDRKKAVQEVIDHLRGIDAPYRRAAEHIVQRDYGLKRIRIPIPDTAAEQFFQRVLETMDTYIPSSSG